ncbi:MAG: endosialidase [Lachnospira sp.]|nr:endosialidase [Lachnospira sp.]
MAVVSELLRSESDGSLSFGNFNLSAKTKRKDFEHQGDVYYVKTFREITRLEKNGSFLYESVPGTAVGHFKETDDGVSFSVEGAEDAQITIGLSEGTEYSVKVGSEDMGTMKTNLGGKLVLSVEFSGKPVQVVIKRA